MFPTYWTWNKLPPCAETKQIPDKGKSYSLFLGDREPNSVFLAPTDPAEIGAILHSMKAEKSCGDDSVTL